MYNMAFDWTVALPYITAAMPGIGGTIKRFAEDFEVEEIPAYAPSGTGDFLFLWMEKKSTGAEFFVREIARRLEIPATEVGTAGLKDRHAVTRQMVSVPAVVEGRIARLDQPPLRVLSISRHGNKLRAGHLRGNRFRILIRDMDLATRDRLPSLLDHLRSFGLPNFFGPQRFGKDGQTLGLGLALFGIRRAEQSEQVLRGPRQPFLRKLALSAVQSALFNACLARRLTDGLFRVVLRGDVMKKVATGGLFLATELDREQERFEAKETVHTGPIFGRKMFAAADQAAGLEAAVLTDAGLDRAAFARFGKLLQGTRRANLVLLNDLTSDWEPDGLRLIFTLPAGSYATVLLAEIMKNSAAAAAEGD
jgi:tRNA pseudouridine13 synthase